MDLDAELLALAGDADSSASENEGQNSSRATDASSARTKRASHAKDRDEPTSSPVKSSQQATMPGSDSDRSGAEDDEDTGPLFPYEKLFYSAQEKEEIMELPEIRREEVLSERAQQVDRRNQGIALRRLLASREREEAARKTKQKRKADKTAPAAVSDAEAAAGAAEGPRKSTRQKLSRKDDATQESIDRLLEQKAHREQARLKRSKASDFFDAQESEEETSEKEEVAEAPDGKGEQDDVDEFGRMRSARQVSSPEPEAPPVELRELNQARFGRSNFSHVCFYPGFSDAIAGCFVRVVVGVNKDTRRNDYRVYRIKKFTEGKPYVMEGRNGRPFVTNQYAFVTCAKNEKQFAFNACSDSHVTPSEFTRYIQALEADGYPVPTKPEVTQKVGDIKALYSHQFTEQELEEKLRRQNAGTDEQDHVDRTRIEARRQRALDEGDDEAVAQCNAELQKLAGFKLVLGNTLSKQQARSSTTNLTTAQSDRLSEINRRNARLNYEAVRRAELEERKRKKLAAARAREMATTPSASGVGTNGSVAPDGAGSSNTPTKNHVGTGGKSTHRRLQPKQSVLYLIRRPPTDDEIIADLDLDIESDLDNL